MSEKPVVEQDERGLDASLDQAIDLAREVRDIHRKLGESAVPDRDLERTLADLTRRRDDVILDIGWLLVAHVEAAGTVVLESPKETGRVVALLQPVLPPVEPPVVEPPPASVPPTEAPAAPQTRRVFEPPRAEGRAPEPPPEKDDEGTSRWVEMPPAVRAAYETPIDPLTAEEKSTLRGVVRTLPAPNLVRTESSLDAAIDHLLGAVDGAEEWLRLPADLRRALVGYCASFARYLQDEVEVGTTSAVSPVFSRLTAFSKEHRPGFVYGLSREHVPTRGEWLLDARLWWEKITAVAKAPIARPDPAANGGEPEPVRPKGNPEKALALVAQAAADGVGEAVLAFTRDALDAGVSQQDPRLVRLLASHLDLLGKEPRFKTLRKAIRDSLADDDAGDAETEDAEAEWLHVELTRGRKAVVVGGDPRPEVRDRIQEAFGFASVEWPEIDPRRVDSLAAQIRRGTIDVVIYLVRFASHGVQYTLAPACRDAGATFAMVPNGYGVSAVRQALERTLPTGK